LLQASRIPMEIPPDTYWDLFFGYSAIWLCIVVYMLRLQGEQRKVATQLEEIRSAQSS